MIPLYDLDAISKCLVMPAERLQRHHQCVPKKAIGIKPEERRLCLFWIEQSLTGRFHIKFPVGRGFSPDPLELRKRLTNYRMVTAGSWAGDIGDPVQSYFWVTSALGAK
jgi:hypothetical protein